MERGIWASEEGREKAKNALKLKGWTQEYLAGASQCTRQTVNRFLAGKPIEKQIFQAICTELGLEWGAIVDLPSKEQPEQAPNLDELVEIIRINLYDSIQDRCGSMRVLDMTQPLDLNAIYTTVNILEKITGRRRLGIAELLQELSLENFERFSLSGVQEARVPGLDAVNKHAKLMILGKPGAGKTTFLKYVTLQCIEGNFKPTFVPIFITLKDFAEDPNQPSLLNYLIQVFKNYGIEPDTKINAGLWTTLLGGNVTPAELLLWQGRVLLLLDGLDEVKEIDGSRVLQQIQGFTNQFPKNPFVITCRIAAREYTFERFVEVEVADFDDQQIAMFATQWFQAKNDEIKANAFVEKIKQDRGIRELATNPLLLTLLCLVFEESGNFPANRSELYEEGLDVLLKKWDVKRNIERDQVYKKLSLKRKEDLLSQIALEAFEQGNYFFKQKDAERYITQYIRNLPNANLDDEVLQLDSEAVLKSIEAQHGLFVERARGIYSFSHLTFHEYFTARKIVTSANSEVLLQSLASHITEKRWREVFLLTIGMLESADDLLRAMKQQTDHLLVSDEKLQQFLTWATEKTKSVQFPYKPPAVRAFYFAHILDHTFDHTVARAHILNHARAHVPTLDHALAHALDHVLARDLAHVLDRAHARAQDLPRARASDHALALAFALDLVIDLDHTLDHALDHTLDYALDLALDHTVARAHAYTLAHARTLARVLALARALALAHAYAHDCFQSSDLQQLIQQLQKRFPYLNQDEKTLRQWWNANGQAWIEQLQTIMIEYRNIGHDWQFSRSQKELLQQYYNANSLLVDCLNSDCYVSRPVREEIEASLLLPLAELEQQFPNQRRS